MFKDFLGNEIKEGDKVVFTTHGGIQPLMKGVVLNLFKREMGDRVSIRGDRTTVRVTWCSNVILNNH